MNKTQCSELHALHTGAFKETEMQTKDFDFLLASLTYRRDSFITHLTQLNGPPIL